MMPPPQDALIAPNAEGKDALDAVQAPPRVALLRTASDPRYPRGGPGVSPDGVARSRVLAYFRAYWLRRTTSSRTLSKAAFNASGSAA